MRPCINRIAKYLSTFSRIYALFSVQHIKEKQIEHTMAKGAINPSRFVGCISDEHFMLIQKQLQVANIFKEHCWQSYRWLCARLPHLQWVSKGDTAVPHPKFSGSYYQIDNSCNLFPTHMHCIFSSLPYYLNAFSKTWCCWFFFWLYRQSSFY